MNKTILLNIENFFIKLFEDLKNCICIEPDKELSIKNNFCETMNQDRINKSINIDVYHDDINHDDVYNCRQLHQINRIMFFTVSKK